MLKTEKIVWAFPSFQLHYKSKVISGIYFSDRDIRFYNLKETNKADITEMTNKVLGCFKNNGNIKE